jgi:FlaA1/EpsC-like NDP-sugar epimerase
MIRLMGFEERSDANPKGEIEIVFTGLRPGEKLVEELLTEACNASATRHPRIKKAFEPGLNSATIERELLNLHRAVELHDRALLLATLRSLVADYSPSSTTMQRAVAPKALIVH